MWLFIHAGFNVNPCQWKGPLLWYNTLWKKSYCKVITLQWRHMNVMTSQIKGKFNVYSTVYSSLHQKQKHQIVALLALCEGNQPITGGKCMHVTISLWLLMIKTDQFVFELVGELQDCFVNWCTVAQYLRLTTQNIPLFWKTRLRYANTTVVRRYFAKWFA